jgi:CRISPR type III-A-associated RAMP protein Csm5
VAVWASSSKQSIPIDVETVAQDTVFATEMTLDTHLFAQSQLGLSEKRGLLENMAEACRTRASQRIEQELDFFTRRNLQPLQRFYEGLRAQLQQCGPQSFLIQIGWGSAWGSKTIEQTLRANDGAIPAAVRRYKLDRGRGRGDDFPATRHLVLDQQQQRVQRPVEPLGWVKVEINEETTP